MDRIGSHQESCGTHDYNFPTENTFLQNRSCKKEKEFQFSCGILSTQYMQENEFPFPILNFPWEFMAHNIPDKWT